MINKLIILGLLCLLSACATETTKQTTSGQPIPSSQSTPLNDEKLKIGMSRAEAEQLLGQPTSITDTADASVLVWVFDPGSNTAKIAQSSNNPGLLSQIGGIAATIAGIFNPIAGVATSVGSQVYSVSQSGASAPISPEDSRSITIEVRADKIVSIQRARIPGNTKR